MFQLSAKSLKNLEGVHPDLQKAVLRAIQITDVDFGVGEGLRSKEQQAKEVAEGSSRTMNSRHITGHAVDLVCYVNGKVSWDWPMYGRIALAMKHASKELGIPLNWGGVWDKELSELSDVPYNDHVEYMERFLQANKRHALADGPHFQLTRQAYPAGPS